MGDVTVQYAENYEVKLNPVPRYGMMQLAPGQSPTGYGKKISTDRMIQFKGEKRWYRVYAICYSNTASHYVIRKGETLFYRDYELETA